MRKSESFVVLHTEDGFVRITQDKNTGTYRMGFKSENGFEWKFISETLFALMVQELSTQPGKSS